jgi:hypothetical protein
MERLNPLLDWINAPVWGRIRRIDVLLVILGIICVGYYGYTSGLMGGLQGGLLFVLMVMISVWLL